MHQGENVRTEARRQQGGLSRRALLCAFSVILLVQASLCLGFSLTKTGLFQDESYTYFLANGSYLYGAPADGMYENGEPFYSALVHTHPFDVDFAKLYGNQRDDNHPPLFYFFFSLAYSLVPGSLSPLIGCVLNTLFMMLCTPLIYVLARTLSLRQIPALALCLLWALSPAMVNTAIFLRMYALQAVTFLLSAIFALRFLQAQRLHPGVCVALFAATLAGFLTQYFYVFFAFALYLLVGLVLLLRRRFAHAGIFAGLCMGGIGAGIAVFPPSLMHLTGSMRGQQALERAASGDDFASYLVRDWQLLDQAVFGGLLVLVLLLLLVCALVLLVLRTRRARADGGATAGAGQRIWWQGLLIVALTAVFFVTMIARVAPYASIRYLLGLQPVLLFVVFAALAALLGQMFRGVRLLPLALLLTLGITANALGFVPGLKYHQQENPAVAQLATQNSTIVAIWNDAIFTEALLPDVLAYHSAGFYSSTQSFQAFVEQEPPQEFSLYVQPSVDLRPYLDILYAAYPGASITKVGETIDSIAVYDVRL